MEIGLGWAYRVSDERNSSRDECGQLGDGVHRPAERLFHCLKSIVSVNTPIHLAVEGEKRTMMASKAQGCQPSKSFTTSSLVIDSTHGPSNTLPWPGIYLMASTLTDFPPAIG